MGVHVGGCIVVYYIYIHCISKKIVQAHAPNVVAEAPSLLVVILLLAPPHILSSFLLMLDFGCPNQFHFCQLRCFLVMDIYQIYFYV
jgi:hypothetical protein